MKDKTTATAGKVGNYDDVCERLAKDLKAELVALVVVDGRHGSGFSCSFPHDSRFSHPVVVADLLRSIANHMDSNAPDGTRVTAFEPSGEA